MNFVYEICVDGQRLYVGITDNLERREKQHNYLLRKGHKKDLYDYLREYHPDHIISLNVLYEFQSRTEAKRKEIFIVLSDYYSENPQLKQKIPTIRG